jgi:hypothetical protein
VLLSILARHDDISFDLDNQAFICFERQNVWDEKIYQSIDYVVKIA